MIIERAVACTAIAVLSGAPMEAASDESQRKVFAEPKPDQALVYLIRPGGASKDFVFADQTVLANLNGNSYAFAYLPPGTSLIWDEAFVRELEFVPGQVYYVVIATGVSLLPDDEGKALLESVKHFRPFDTKDAADGSKMVVARYAQAKAFAETRARAPLPGVPAPSPPPQTEGFLRVPAYSAANLELMETISSKLGEAGQTVAFRVAEDAAIDGKVWLHAGTPVQGLVVEARHSARNGWPGSLEVRIPALPGPQGAMIPAVGQLVSIGKSKTGAANWAGLGGGLLGRALVKGHDAELSAGLRLTVFTRNEAWMELASQPAPR